MNINGINRNNTAGGLYESQLKDSAAKYDSRKLPISKTDKIELSKEAQNLSIVDFSTVKIKSDMSKDVSLEKINRLKDSIKNGSYRPDSKAIANSIISGAFAD